MNQRISVGYLKGFTSKDLGKFKCLGVFGVDLLEGADLSGEFSVGVTHGLDVVTGDGVTDFGLQIHFVLLLFLHTDNMLNLRSFCKERNARSR